MPAARTRPVARIVNEPVPVSIIVPAGSAGSHAGLPFAGISSIVYAASVEPGTLRHERGSASAAVARVNLWLMGVGAGTLVQFAQ